MREIEAKTTDNNTSNNNGKNIIQIKLIFIYYYICVMSNAGYFHYFLHISEQERGDRNAV